MKILITRTIAIIVAYSFLIIAAFTSNGRAWDEIPQDSRLIIIMGYVTFITIQMLILTTGGSRVIASQPPQPESEP